MRSYSEIKKRIDTSKTFFGFDIEVLAFYLPYDEGGKELCKPEITEDDWNSDVHSNTVDSIYEELRSYMEFAWEKALDERGLSAVRSIEKLTALVWLLGRDDMVNYLDSNDGGSYGKNHLLYICRELELPAPEGVR